MKLTNLPNEIIALILDHFSPRFLGVVGLSADENVRTLANNIMNKKITDAEINECDTLCFVVLEIIGSPLNLTPDKFSDIILSSDVIRFEELNRKYERYINLLNYLNFIDVIYQDAGQLLFADWQNVVMTLLIGMLNKYAKEYYAVAIPLRQDPFG